MNWFRWKNQYFLFSLLLLVAGSFFLVRGGLQPSVEFTGGTTLRISAPNINREPLQTALDEVIPQEEVSINQESSGDYLLQLETKTNAQKDELLTKLREKTGAAIKEKSFQTVGPSVGKELVQKTFFAILLAVVVILLYVWVQFRDWRFGLGAVLAMLHDSLILIGAYAALGFFFGAKADILFVTAVLTVLSFSVHDTIVLFDQVRELQKTGQRQPFITIANTAITQTLSRSLNNSLTILLMLLALLLLGGESLRWFTAALFIGTLIGTYSSSFVALPLVIELKKLKKR